MTRNGQKVQLLNDSKIVITIYKPAKMNTNYVVVQLDQTETVESEGQKGIPAVRESPESSAS